MRSSRRPAQKRGAIPEIAIYDQAMRRRELRKRKSLSKIADDRIMSLIVRHYEWGKEILGPIVGSGVGGVAAEIAEVPHSSARG
jgi:hypothetical protein